MAASAQRHDVIWLIVEGVAVAVVPINCWSGTLATLTDVFVEGSGALSPFCHLNIIALPCIVRFTTHNRLVRPG